MISKSHIFSPGSFFIFILILTAIIIKTQCTQDKRIKVFSFRDVKDYPEYRWEEDSSALFFSGNSSISLNPVHLKAGRYSLIFKARGEIAVGIMPNLSIFLGYAHIRELSISEGTNDYRINFQLEKDFTEPLHIAFTNDYSNTTEDRNAVLSFPMIIERY